VVGALLVEWLRGRGKASGDLALALFFYGGIAAGAVFASRAAAEGISVNVVPYLFGSILTVSPTDVWVVAAIGTLIVACTMVTGRALLSVVLDDGAARVAGIPVDGLNALLAILTAVTIVAATRIVGVLLIAALMVLPVASSRLLARSFRTTIVGAAGIGALSAVIGLAAARMWGLAPGGAIVLVATGIFAIVAGITGTTRAGFSLPSHH
ncbi:MAG: metal ABC transporter permease, partial [Acidimicrobiia bacterium]|nr:metal ABC transporter permease [Acidimicrobiia bacterium]